VVVPLLHEPGAKWDAFVRRWEELFGSPPDETAAQSYDAVRLIAAALARSGAHRALLLDALRTVVPWTGIMGVHDWDGLGRNRRAPGLGRWEAGRVVPVPTHTPRSTP
jgi:ABC-type branched-subunit amino acid transport system substrate-binding protein